MTPEDSARRSAASARSPRPTPPSWTPPASSCGRRWPREMLAAGDGGAARSQDRPPGWPSRARPSSQAAPADPRRVTSRRPATAGRPAPAAELPAAVDRRDDQRRRQFDGRRRGPVARGDGAAREYLRRRGADRRGVPALAGDRPAGWRLGGPAAGPAADDRLRRDLRAAVREPARRRLARGADHRAGRGRGAAGRDGQRLLRHRLPGLPAGPGHHGRTRRGQRQAAGRRVGGRDRRPRRGGPGGRGGRRRHRAAVQRGQLRRVGRLPAAPSARWRPLRQR